MDALGLLAGRPAELAAVAEEEDLLGVLPPAALEVARRLLRAELVTSEVPGALEGTLDAASLGRIRLLCGAAAPATREQAERDLRRSVVKAKIERIEREHERLSAAVARAGSPVPEELVQEQLTLVARLRDLRKRLGQLERA